MPRKPKSGDDENLGILSGAVSTASGSELADALLEATLLMRRVSVLLSEATAEDWRELRPRLRALNEAVSAIPARAPKRKRLGFG